MSIREEDKVTVCRHCLSVNLDGAEHGRTIPDGPEDAHTGCLWPCGHEVYREEASCFACNRPTDEPPF